MQPYLDEVIYDRFCSEEKIFERKFDSFVSPTELVWHRDRNDRTIYVVQGEMWKLQFDNSLPIILEQGNSYTIKKNIYHRLLKGNGDLVLRIKETINENL